MFIDSHCHLSFPLAQDLPGVLQRMRDNDVVAALNICTTLEEFPAVVAVAEQHAHVFASAGVHPDNQGVEEPTVERLVELADHPEVVAIGETGLDYFRLQEPLDWQRSRFRTHIRAAHQCGKPLIIHTRIAGGHDTFDAGGGRREGRGRDALFHRVACRGTSGNGSRLLYLLFRDRHFQECQALQEVARAVPLTGC